MNDQDNQQGAQFGGDAKGTVKQQKQTYFVIMYALVVSVGIYIFLCFLMSQNRRPLSPPPAAGGIITILAVMALVASIAWLHFRTSGKAGDAPAMSTAPSVLMSPAEFQTETIIAMALAEACAILGLTLFFMGGPLKGFIPFAAGTVAVDLAYILPKALRYWAAYEKSQNPNKGPFEL